MVDDPHHYTTGLPCVYHDAWLGRGNCLALPKVVWLEFSKYMVDPRL